MTEQKNHSAEIDKLWDYDKPAESEKRFRELLPEAQKTGDRGYQAEVLSQIARSLSLQRKFDDAHKTLDHARKILPAEARRAALRIKLERGRTYNSSDQKDKARPLFLAAWEEALAAKEDFYAIDAAHMMAIVEPTDKQTEWNLKALELAERTFDPRAKNWRGSLYNNIGWTYHSQGKFDAALDLFQKALKCRQEQNQPQQIRIAKWCIARTLRSLSRIDEAFKMQQQLHEEFGAINAPDPYVNEELGECLILLHRSDEAAGYFAYAYRELSKDAWFAEHETARLKRLKDLGKVP